MSCIELVILTVVIGAMVILFGYVMIAKLGEEGRKIVTMQKNRWISFMTNCQR